MTEREWGWLLLGSAVLLGGFAAWGYDRDEGMEWGCVLAPVFLLAIGLFLVGVLLAGNAPVGNAGAGGAPGRVQSGGTPDTPSTQC